MFDINSKRLVLKTSCVMNLFFYINTFWKKMKLWHKNLDPVTGLVSPRENYKVKPRMLSSIGTSIVSPRVEKSKTFKLVPDKDDLYNKTKAAMTPSTLISSEDHSTVMSPNGEYSRNTSRVDLYNEIGAKSFNSVTPRINQGISIILCLPKLQLL